MDLEKETKLYENAIRQKSMSIEKLLIQAFFPQSQKTLNDPRFQLAAWHMIANHADARNYLNEFAAILRSKTGEDIMSPDEFLQDSRRALTIFGYLLMTAETVFLTGNPFIAQYALQEAIESNEALRQAADPEAFNLLFEKLIAMYYEDAKARKFIFSGSELRDDERLFVGRIPDTEDVRVQDQIRDRSLMPVSVDGSRFYAGWISQHLIPGGVVKVDGIYDMSDLEAHLAEQQLQAAQAARRGAERVRGPRLKWLILPRGR